MLVGLLDPLGSPKVGDALLNRQGREVLLDLWVA